MLLCTKEDATTVEELICEFDFFDLAYLGDHYKMAYYILVYTRIKDEYLPLEEIQKGNVSEVALAFSLFLIVIRSLDVELSPLQQAKIKSIRQRLPLEYRAVA